MSGIEIGELLGTLSRDKQRQQQPLNQFYAEQNKQILSEKLVEPIADYSTATPKELQAELRREIKLLKQHIEEIQNDSLHTDELQRLNDEINRSMSARFKISKILGIECPHKGYRYFGAYRDFILRTSKKKMVRKILESSDSEEEVKAESDSIPFSFQRERRRSNTQVTAAVHIHAKRPTVRNTVNSSVDTLESKIYKLFNLQNGCKKTYTTTASGDTLPTKFAPDIEFDEERLENLDKEAAESFAAAQAVEMAHKALNLKLFEERKRKIMEEYV
ncbi:P2 response regulator binding domain protein [Perkinsela sp. CCAP 1560/4]|nr:P2 response regulator binding domain protein [Perkinsela sp. CCAP 1560/4]|eukprot:KNH07128.1 P2 response regulator binding domain protein [Perkinsela sp. CCAP 1560/4]